MDESRLKRIPIVVERHPDTFLAYPLGVEGVVIGEGDSFEEALADCQSAIRFHVETFGESVLDIESPVLEATLVQPTTA
jgi:predicted RNase H-like HicB family nuclease